MNVTILVIDSNILFAALIKVGSTSDLLFSDKFRFYAPQFIFEEFEQYKELLISKTKRSDHDFNKLIGLFKRRITIIPKKEVDPFIDKAKEISPDIKDVPYVALALKLNAAIWSNDKDLKEKLNVVKVYSTEEVMKF
jgi:predicted nucleic acid-binding protein